MNLLEHYIKEVHSVEDVSNKFEEKSDYPPNEPLLKVDLTYDCYGKVERGIKMFFKSEWDSAREKGYFME